MITRSNPYIQNIQKGFLFGGCLSKFKQMREKKLT